MKTSRIFIRIYHSKFSKALFFFTILLISLFAELAIYVELACTQPTAIPDDNDPISTEETMSYTVYLPLVMHQDPIYAVWVQGRDVNTKAKANAIIELVQQGKFDTILLWVGHGIVTYQKTNLLNKYSTGGYDPLAYVIKLAHARNIKVQAWWSPGLAPTYMPFRKQHPEWDIASVTGIPSDYHWFNFSVPQARRFVGDVVLEIAENYDVDGIHLDVIRYPQPGYYPGVDPRDFFNETDVPHTVSSTYWRLKDQYAYVTLSAAVMDRGGELNMQNWFEWLEGDYIDYVMPMAYYAPDDNARLQTAIELWQEQHDEYRIIPGLSGVVNFSDEVPKTPSEFLAQLNMTRDANFLSFALFDITKTSEETIRAIGEYLPK